MHTVSYFLQNSSMQLLDAKFKTGALVHVARLHLILSQACIKKSFPCVTVFLDWLL